MSGMTKHLSSTAILTSEVDPLSTCCTAPLRLWSRKLLQILHLDPLQRLLVRCRQEHPSRNQFRVCFSRRGVSTTYFGTTGSSGPLAACIASLHRFTQRHHLHPPLSPMMRRSLPREAEKARNSSVISAVVTPCQPGTLVEWNSKETPSCALPAMACTPPSSGPTSQYPFR